MPVNTNDYSREHLLGNVQVARSTLATLRGSVRRNDPDGVSNVPYFTGASGKTLRVTYTKEIVGVVTDTLVDIALTSTSMATIISTINAVDVSNLQASDGGGYLVLTNLNPGKTHRLEVNQYSTPSSDAASIFGLTQTPYPGGTSYVNEISSAPGEKESNPQGTALIASGEDFRTAGFNRALGSLLELIASNGIDLDTPVIVFKEKQLSFALQAATGKYFVNINDDAIRVPIYDPAIGSFKPLTKYFKIYEDLGNHYPTRSLATTTSAIGSTGFNAFQYHEDYVSAVVYGTSGINIDESTAFATWGTPDGHSIYDSSVPNKDKHASTTVTSIVGNIVYCAAATFVTHKVQAGDPVFLTASTLTPFDHTGWFIVKKVYDETHIAVRPVSAAELVPTVANKPRSLNPGAGGTLRVAVGYYIPASNLLMVLSSGRVLTNALVRIACAVPLREAIAGELSNTNDGTAESILSALNDHLFAGVANGHPPEAIKGINLPAFADTTQITDASTDLKATLTDLVSTLASTSSTGSQGGTKKIGAQAISIGGASPNSLSAGTLYSQLSALLTDVQTASTAAGTSYAGGGTWADGTTNPATTVEAQLDKIISDLGTTGGAAKIQYNGGGSWADGTTNPAATVEAQLDKVITDLSGTGGTAKVGGAASTDLTADTLANQILALASGWLKMNRVNTISAAQTFSALLTASLGVLVGTNHDVTVSGTGKYKRGTRVRKISATAGALVTGGQWLVNSGFTGAWRPLADGDTLAIPVIVEEYETITQIDFSVDGDAGCTVSATLYAVDDAGHVGSAISETKTSTAAHTLQTLSITQASGLGGALAELVDNSSRLYYILVTASGTPTGTPVPGPFVIGAAVTTTI